MAIERTFSIIKPDAVAKNKIGEVVSLLEAGGLRVVAQRMVRLTREQAEEFYGVHREKGFFASLVKFMTEGPVVVQVLEGENAITRNREIMGATDSRKAAPGTIRNKLGTDIEKNAVHGSDAPETARQEIGFFFTGAELTSTERAK
jgi:nucleoside-diphosphate kinase